MYKLFFIACLLFTCNADAKMIQRTQVVMSTFVSLSVDKEHIQLIKPAFAIIKSIENSLSSYKESSVISQTSSLR